MRVVGPYTLSHKIGEGGMAEVWKGQRVAASGATKDVAIKLLLPAHADHEQFRQMFDEEARLSMLLNSSNIVQVFDVGSDGGECYMAMEWVDGLDLETLTKRLRRVGRKLPLFVVTYIIGEVLKALAHAHDFKHEGGRLTVVHRDVSPHNIMVSVTGDVKLMDFGIARLSSEDTSGIHVKGKLRYMPPEQFRGETRRPTIDLFSVGAIFHELLDGHRFRGETVDNTHMFGLIITGEVPPLTIEPRDLPLELDTLRRTLLAAEAAERVQSAREAFRELRQWSGYRDAKFELEDLVSGFSGTDPAPISRILDDDELTIALPVKALPDERMESQTDISPAAGPPASPRSEVTARGAPVSARARPPLVAVALVGAAIVTAATVATVVVLRSSAPSARTEVAARDSQDEEPGAQTAASNTSAPVDQAPAPQAPSPVAPPQLEPPVPEQPSLAEPPTQANAEVEIVTAEVETIEAETKKARRVAVTISAPEVYWAQVKLGNKISTLDRLEGGARSVRLEPGEYAVSYRESAKGRWQGAGKVTVPDRRCRLELRGGRVKIK